MGTPLLVHIEALSTAERDIIASRWGAPSPTPHLLERYLLSREAVQHRLDGVSGHALDELVGLVEASRAGVPVAQVSELAAFELEEALLVGRPPEAPHLVFLPDEVAVVVLETVAASPCRLRLLLAGLDGDALCALSARLGDILGPFARSLSQSEAVLAALTEPHSLAAVVESLDDESRGLLWDLVDAGGYLPDPDQVRAGALAALRRLEALGLVWWQPTDARIAAEVLRALLELRMSVQVSDLLGTFEQLQRGGAQDNLLMFPTASGRLLGEMAEVLHARANLPLEELGAALGIYGDTRPIEALVELAAACGLARMRGNRCVAGPVVRIERRFEQWRAMTEDARMAQLVASIVDDGALAALDRPIAALLTRESFGEAEGVDDDELTGWAALPPHLVADLESGAVDHGGQSRARSLLRVALQALFARLEPGRLYPLEVVFIGCEYAAAMARTWARLVGQLYGPTLAPPSVASAHQAVRDYFEAVAVPLGWAALELDRAPVEERVTGRVVEAPSATLSLFPLETVSPEMDLVDDEPEPSSGPDDGVGSLRVVRTWPLPPASAIEGLLAEAGRHRPMLGWLLGESAHWTLAPLVVGARTPELSSALQGRSSALKRELQAFCAQLDEPTWLEAARRVSTHLTEVCALAGVDEVDEAAIEGLLRRVLEGHRKDRDRLGLRRMFAAIDALEQWARTRRYAPRLDASALRSRLEGAVLRAETVDSALRLFQRRVPPADMLRHRPNLTFQGEVRVLQIDRDLGRLKVAPADERGQDWANEWVVRTDVRPLFFLRRGDIISAKLVRYGHECWITSLSWVLPPELEREDAR